MGMRRSATETEPGSGTGVHKTLGQRRPRCKAQCQYLCASAAVTVWENCRCTTVS